MPSNTFENVGNLVFEMPWFIHEFGDEWHHASLMRKCARDDDGDYVWSTAPRKWRFIIHEFLDLNFFYPFRRWLRENDGRKINILDDWLLTPFWGINCGFPFRDVVLYTMWCIHGCPAVKVWKSEDLK